MSEEKHGAGVGPAWRMLTLFASLGASHFDLTRTGLDGRLRGFQRGWAPAREELAGMLEGALARRHNLIVRPRPEGGPGGATLVQLDDLEAAAVERIRRAAFLVLATSPGNYQAWVGVSPGGEECARRLRRGLGADPGASGAVRLAGSRNFKPAYAPDFPVVTLLGATPGHTVGPRELAGLGVLAPGEAGASPGASPPRLARWPSYERCLRQAPRAQSRDRPDVSRADFTFCLLAIDWGWSVEAASGRLREVSSKASVRGEAYARLTAEHAAAAVAGRRARRLV